MDSETFLMSDQRFAHRIPLFTEISILMVGIHVIKVFLFLWEEYFLLLQGPFNFFYFNFFFFVKLSCNMQVPLFFKILPYVAKAIHLKVLTCLIGCLNT